MGVNRTMNPYEFTPTETHMYDGIMNVVVGDNPWMIIVK